MQSDHHELRAMFNHYDDDKNGELCPVEIKKLARELGKDLSKHELETLMVEIDADGDGGACCFSFCSCSV